MRHVQPIIDIICPFWGDATMLHAMVDSVRAQSADNWRLVVVDDCYPDPAASAWVGELEDARITHVRNETNLGITRNFARCRDLARGARVTIIGCDDLLEPNYVDVITRTHQAFPEAAMIQPGVRIVDERGRDVLPLTDRIKQRLIMPRVTRATELSGERLATSLLRGNWMYWPSVAFAPEQMRQVAFRPEFPVQQDLALYIDLIRRGASLVLEPEVCFTYRRHTGSASESAIFDGSRFRADRAYFRVAEQLMRDASWPAAARAARLRVISRAHALSVMPSALRAGRRDSFRHLARHAFGR